MPLQDDVSHTGGQASPQKPAQTPPEQPLQEQAEFLAKISHEIRTPLNAIMGYAEMLSKTGLDAKQQHFAANIVKSSLSLVDLLNTWLQQAKDPSVQPALPAQPAAPSTDAPVAVQEPAALQPFKLLVVEDSSMIRNLFMDIFSEDRFAILTASSGAKALELAHAELPQLIFLDLHLPDTDGWQVAKSLRSNAATAAIPLIVMTGQLLKTEEYSPYFDEFLQKPFQLKQLRSMVDSWLRTLSEKTARPVPALPEAVITIDENAGQDLAQSIQHCWTMQLSKHLAAAHHTGSLDVAIELGKCMQNTGREKHCLAMGQAGSELVDCATVPNIAGLERIIAKLMPLLQAARK